jgi:hypothetical protein
MPCEQERSGLGVSEGEMAKAVGFFGCKQSASLLDALLDH